MNQKIIEEEVEKFKERFVFGVKYKEKDGIEIVDFDYHKDELEEATTFLKESLLRIHSQTLRTLREGVEKERIDIGDETYCLYCKQHRAAGDCDCRGINKGLDLIINKYLTE